MVVQCAESINKTNNYLAKKESFGTFWVPLLANPNTHVGSKRCQLQEKLQLTIHFLNREESNKNIKKVSACTRNFGKNRFLLQVNTRRVIADQPLSQPKKCTNPLLWKIYNNQQESQLYIVLN